MGEERRVVEVDAARFDRPDLDTVNALARLNLAAKRLGWAVRLRNPTCELRALLEYVGLGLLLESGGQAEDREQLGVEEVVEPRDLPA